MAERVDAMNYKALGEVVELRFYLKAFEKGLIVSKPFGDSAKYDFIVDSGNGLYRVQVKSTQRLDTSNRGNRYTVSFCCSGDKRIYKNEEIDFIVAYITPLDTWYIIPITAIHSKNGNFRPHKDGKGKMEEYKEAWGLFK